MLRLECQGQGAEARILRVAAGLTQQEVAAAVGVDRRRLSEHERGERPLSADELDRLGAALEQAVAGRAEISSRASH